MYKIIKTQRTSLIFFCVMLFLSSACVSVRRMHRNNAQAEKVVEEARTFMGVPYQWGGVTRSGMDCSGLLLNAFQAIDVKIPRTSQQQALLGKKVSVKKLKPGDLLFFATGKKRRKVSHVGLVTSTEGHKRVKFIHASSSLGVLETNLYAQYYWKKFLFAKRLIR